MLDTAHYKAELKALRQTLSQRLGAIHKDLHHEEETVEKDFAEQATQRENEDVLKSLDNETQQTIMAIDKALLRIESGEYGFCETCGEAISEQRLQAVPFATHCIECAE